MSEPSKTVAQPSPSGPGLADRFEDFLFGGRWILAPMYFGLTIALALYAVKFSIELIELCRHFLTLTEPQLLVGILDLVDISMIGNLVFFVIIGSYSIFVRRVRVKNDLSKLSWLDTIDSSTIKVKMGKSLIGVSSIYLLKSFLDAQTLETKTLTMQIAIHLVFVVSTVAMAYTSKLLHAGEHHNHSEPAKVPHEA